MIKQYFWDILLLPNEIYLYLLCLKEICGLVQDYVHHILHDLLANAWNTLKASLCFKFKEFMPPAVSLSSIIFGINFGIAEVLFCSWFSIIFSLAIWVLIVNLGLIKLTKILVNLATIWFKIYFAHIYNILNSWFLQFV